MWGDALIRNSYALDETVAIVTGSANGIGKTTAKRLASEGVSVVVRDRDEDAGNRVTKDIRADGHEAIFVSTDQARPEAIETGQPVLVN